MTEFNKAKKVLEAHGVDVDFDRDHDEIEFITTADWDIYQMTNGLLQIDDGEASIDNLTADQIIDTLIAEGLY